MMKSVVIVGLLLAAVPPGLSARERRRAECKSIHATLGEQQVREVCPSTFCATGTLDGNHGVNGPTHFVLDSSAPAPSTAPVVSVAYSGLFEIAAPDGSLTLRETGVNTPRPGGGRNIAGVASVVSGSGRFAGATGTIFFNGINVIPGVFSTDVSGELCFAGGES
jgi:hypothetical protein